MVLRYIYTDDVTCPDGRIENSFKKFENMIKIFQMCMIDGFPDYLWYLLWKNHTHDKTLFLPENFRSKEANWSSSCENLTGYYNITKHYVKC